MSPLVSEPVEIAVVDYGMGNRRSVEKALEHVGARTLVSSDPERLRAADGLVVPGVGAFPRAMANLSASASMSCCASVSARACPCWASASACSWPSSTPPSRAAPRASA